MASYLVVAHQTATSPELIERAKSIAAGDRDARFALLVPATHATHLLHASSADARFTWDDDRTYAAARARADEAGERFRSAGLTVERTAVGDASPLLAIEDEMRLRPGYYQVLPYSLKLVGAFGSNGEHPISVASSGNWVYVLNTGGTGNITGFEIDYDGWLWPVGWSTQGLGVAYPASAEQVGFSPNGRFVVVTLKDGNGIVTYVVNPDGTTDGPTLTDSVVPAPYAFGFDDVGRLLVANAASSSVASYNIFPNGSIQYIDLLGDGQKAACWIVVTSDGAYLYTANAGSANVSGYKITVEGELGLLGKDGIAAKSDGKPLDLALSSGDGYLYVLDAAGGDIDAYKVFWDGSLLEITGVDGITATTTGLAAR